MMCVQSYPMVPGLLVCVDKALDEVKLCLDQQDQEVPLPTFLENQTHAGGSSQEELGLLWHVAQGALTEPAASIWVSMQEWAKSRGEQLRLSFI